MLAPASCGDLAAVLGARAAGFGARLAFIRIELRALVGAGCAKVGANGAHAPGVLGPTGQHLHTGGTKGDAVETVCETLLHLRLTQMIGKTGIRGLDTFVTGVDRCL